MSRARLVEVVLSAWPTEVRAERGPEMADALLEASEHSRVRFAREVVALAWRGLGARALRQRSTARLFADGACLAGALYAAVCLAEDLWVTSASASHADVVVPLTFFAAVLGLAMIGRNRAGGVVLLGSVAWELASAFPHGEFAPLWWVRLLLPTCCGVVMVATPGRRRLHFALLYGALPLAALVGGHGAIEDCLWAIGAASLLAAAVDVRPLIACGMALFAAGLTLVAIGSDPAAMFTLLTVAPALLAASALRARREPA